MAWFGLIKTRVVERAETQMSFIPLLIDYGGALGNQFVYRD